MDETLARPPATAVPIRTSWRLAPSDFAFLWEECRRCFWLKVVRGDGRPSMPFPGIFSKIDGRMKEHFEGQPTSAFGAAIPPGVFAHFGKKVESRTLNPRGEARGCFVRGSFDTVIAFDDGTFGVVDFKTSSPKSATVSLYARQLHAYAWALERPAPGALRLAPVSRLGLLVFEPDLFARHEEGRARLDGSLTWIEIPRDDAAFERFLGDVLQVLALDEPPAPTPACAWCAFRERVGGGR